MIETMNKKEHENFIKYMQGKYHEIPSFRTSVCRLFHNGDKIIKVANTKMGLEYLAKEVELSEKYSQLPRADEFVENLAVEYEMPEGLTPTKEHSRKLFNNFNLKVFDSILAITNYERFYKANLMRNAKPEDIPSRDKVYNWGVNLKEHIDTNFKVNHPIHLLYNLAVEEKIESNELLGSMCLDWGGNLTVGYYGITEEIYFNNTNRIVVLDIESGGKGGIIISEFKDLENNSVLGFQGNFRGVSNLESKKFFNECVNQVWQIIKSDLISPDANNTSYLNYYRGIISPNVESLKGRKKETL